jgi:hypothetical protein
MLHIAPGGEAGMADGGSLRVSNRVVGDVSMDEMTVVGVKCEGARGNEPEVGAPRGVSGRNR